MDPKRREQPRGRYNRGEGRSCRCRQPRAVARRSTRGVRQLERETEAGRAMSDADGNKERNREIARNEDVRQTTGDIRVSAWAIVFSIIIAVIVVGAVWGWIRH